jgi:diadenosine tetraphosphatase ApaH/serine/threonine PP2A family protein phosphatase
LVYGFFEECKTKYDEEIYELFHDVFNCLPLGYILNNRVLVVHGGLTKDQMSIAKL